MYFLNRILKVTAVAMVACLFVGNSANAHDALKDPLKKRYGLKNISCKACHPGSTKAINNAFGLKFKTAFKGKNYTKRVEEAKELKKKDKAAGEKALEAVEAEIVEHFNQVIPEIEKETMTFADMAKYGILNGTTLEKSVIAEMGKAQGVEEK